MATKKAASPAQLVRQRKLTTNERNWSFVLIVVFAAAVLVGLWYFTSGPGVDSNGNIKAVTAPTHVSK